MPAETRSRQDIADHYLEDVRTFNEVRNMLGFTGTYQGQPVSVMGGGMGMPSIGIYSHELYEFYGVESIIRVGSAGGIDPSIKVRDVVAGGRLHRLQLRRPVQPPRLLRPHRKL